MLTLVDADRSDENGLPLLMNFGDISHDCVILLTTSAIDQVNIILTHHRIVRRDKRDLQSVDLLKFSRFSICSTGHSTELLVHAEIVLEGNGCQRLILASDRNSLFCFNSLMKPVRPSTPRHKSSGKLVDDNNLSTLNNVVHITLKRGVGSQRLLHVVHELDVTWIEEILNVKKLLYSLNADVRERWLLRLQINFEIFVALQTWNDLVDDEVFIGRLLGRAGNDERRTSFIDQDRVNFVYDCEVVSALNHLPGGELHIISEIIEAELIVLSVRNVGLICSSSHLLAHALIDAAYGETQEGMNASHPLRVTLGEIVVHRYNVNTLASKGIKI